MLILWLDKHNRNNAFTRRLWWQVDKYYSWRMSKASMKHYRTYKMHVAQGEEEGTFLDIAWQYYAAKIDFISRKRKIAEINECNWKRHHKQAAKKDK